MKLIDNNKKKKKNMFFWNNFDHLALKVSFNINGIEHC